MISVYTDACRKKTGMGGYGYLIKNTNFTTFAGSYLEGITNNYAELEAVIQLCNRMMKDFMKELQMILYSIKLTG